MEWVCFSFCNKHVNLPFNAATVILLCNILQLATTWILTGYCDVIVLVVHSVGYCIYEWVVITFGTTACLSTWGLLNWSYLFWFVMTYLQWRFYDKSNCRFFLCYDEFGSGVPVWCAGHPQGCVALFVIVFGTSDPDVRSLWSSCLGFWCGYWW